MSEVLDPVVGGCFVLLAVGLARRFTWSAAFAAATAGLWFLGDLVGAAVLAHRGPLTDLLLRHPHQQRTVRVRVAVVALVYADALILPLGRNSVITLVLAVAVVALAAHGYRGARGPTARRPLLGPMLFTVGVWGVLGAGATARLMALHAGSQLVTTYEIVLIAGSLALLVDARYGRWNRAAITRLVVELGHAPATPLRDRLADALGDQSLALGYPDSEGGFRDESGTPVDATSGRPGRTVTVLKDGDRTIAVLVHDTAVLDDPTLLEAVGSLAKTAIANRQLEREAQDRYTALEQSRRRLLSAVDEERARLEAELRGGAQRELEHAAKILRDLPDGGGALATRLAASQQVIHEFARGVHPRALTEAGLSAALAELTSAAADPVTAATVPEGRFPRDVETAAYFICAEALANATKYANASRVDMLIYVEDDQLIVDIKDDGCGGADPSRGSGLRGLADRVDVLRGTLAVTSSPGAGTRVRAVLPLNAAAPAAEADTAR